MDSEVPKNPSISLATLHGVVLLAHSVRPMGDYDWGRMVGALWEVGRERGEIRALVYSPGPGPNANQRLRLTELSEHFPVRVALCTESRIARAVAVAVNWASNIDIRPFKSSELEAACEFLDLGPEHRGAVMSLFHRLRREMN